MDKTQYAVPRQLPTSAEVISADYDPKIDVFTGMPDRFAMGGLASIHRFDGEDGSQVEASSWNPESGQVKLQATDPQDPYGAMKTVDYTIPTDQIKNFAPTLDPETGKPTGGGAYALNDGSTMHIGRDGIVQAATPARNEYTLNKDGYYQPTGAGLTWNGGLNQLTKKIGGVDVVVDPLFTKGGYQDAKGNLSVDENGVPIPLPPAQLDSGAGASWVSEYAPYMTTALLTAGAGIHAMGAMTAAEAAAAAGATAGTVGAPIASPSLGITAIAPEAAGAIGATSVPVTSTLTPAANAILGGTTGTTATTGGFGIKAAGGLGGGTAGTAGMTTGQKILATTLAAKALSGDSGGGGSSGPSATTTTTQAPPNQNIASSTYNPAFTMPNMFASNQAAPGSYYQAPTYRYYAQGGVADLGGYAVGGKLLKGDGDGMSDSIVANINGRQPARLATSEFVVPADVVSHLGNGSTDAGAKILYKMMDRIRMARTGTKKQGKRINPDKYLPKG
jgi:hypothetical protein